MRKTMLLGTALAALFAATLTLPAAAAAPTLSSPTCLMTTSVAKASLCAQMVASGANRSAVATYQAAGEEPVTLTVSVESGGLNQPADVLAGNTMTGIGNLTETTKSVPVTANDTLLRACAKLTWPTKPGSLLVCTAA